MPELEFRVALREAIDAEMARDPAVVVFGEDVADATRDEPLRTGKLKGKGGVKVEGAAYEVKVTGPGGVEFPATTTRTPDGARERAARGVRAGPATRRAHAGAARGPRRARRAHGARVRARGGPAGACDLRLGAGYVSPSDETI